MSTDDVLQTFVAEARELPGSGIPGETRLHALLGTGAVEGAAGVDGHRSADD